MQSRSSELIVLLVAVILLVLANGLQGTLVSVRASEEGMADEIIGIIMSANFVGFVAGSVLAPHLVQRVGHIRAFAALASTASAVALALAIFVDPVVWTALRAAHGLCYAGLIIVVESWLNASTERSARGRVLAIYSVTVYAAWAISQPLLDLAPTDGFILFCVVSIALSLALVPITLSRAGVPGVVQATRLGLRRLYEVSPVGVVGAFVTGLTASAFFSMAPAFASTSGLSDGQIAIFIAMPLIGALTLQWPLGWLSDLWDRRIVISGAALGAVLIGLGLMLAAANGLMWLFALAFLLGGTMMPIYSLCVAHANDHVTTEEVIAAASGLILVYGLGSTLGPFLSSLLMGRIGPSGLFLFIAGAMAVFVAFTLYRIGRQSPTAREDKESYIAVPQTSHANLPLHEHGSGEAEGEPAPR